MKRDPQKYMVSAGTSKEVFGWAPSLEEAEALRTKAIFNYGYNSAAIYRAYDDGRFEPVITRRFR